MKPLSKAVYRIQGSSGSKQRRMIVHFNRLKPGTELVTMNLKSTANENKSRSNEPVSFNNHQPHRYVAESVEYEDSW